MINKAKRRIGTNGSWGFSIIELLIALWIFSTCLLAIYGLFPMAMKAVNQGELNFLANQVAKNEMEYLKTISWDDLTMDNPAITNRPPTILTTTVNGVTHTTSFESNIRIDPHPDEPDNIKVARVQVKWVTGTPSGNKFNYVELQTFINNPKQ